jgi:hypothetical protein
MGEAMTVTERGSGNLEARFLLDARSGPSLLPRNGGGGPLI